MLYICPLYVYMFTVTVMKAYNDSMRLKIDWFCFTKPERIHDR